MDSPEGNYTRWEAFRETIDLSLRALIEIYRPAYFTRIGLRYINLVNREKIGLEDAHWASLLSKDISSELSIPFFERNIDEFQKLIRINNPNGQGGFLLQHGIVKDQNATSKVYSIDFDFYHDKRTEVNLALAIADELHRLSGRAFRWAISDLLHSSLGPTAVDADENLELTNVDQHGLSSVRFTTSITVAGVSLNEIPASTLNRAVCLYYLWHLNGESLVEACQSLSAIYNWQRGLELPTEMTVSKHSLNPAKRVVKASRVPFFTDED